MHHTLAAIAIGIFIVTTTARAGAQTIVPLPDYEAARAGFRLGYGGRGLDLQASADSPRFVGLVRFRADVGQGHWVGINNERFAPRVTRFAASALLYFVHRDQPEFPAYVGVGIGAFVPHGDGFATQTGKRVILGMEHSGDRWTVGPEIEIDLSPGGRDEFGRRGLVPTMRMGIAIRRNF